MKALITAPLMCGLILVATPVGRSPAFPVAGQDQQNPAPSYPPAVGQPTEPVILWPALPPSATRFPDEPQEEQPKPHRAPFDAARARQQAQELAQLANKIPGEIDQVSKSVLPKDLNEQLKRIQKLAKQLRSQIAQ